MFAPNMHLPRRVRRDPVVTFQQVGGSPAYPRLLMDLIGVERGSRCDGIGMHGDQTRRHFDIYILDGRLPLPL